MQCIKKITLQFRKDRNFYNLRKHESINIIPS